MIFIGAANMDNEPCVQYGISEEIIYPFPIFISFYLAYNYLSVLATKLVHVD